MRPLAAFLLAGCELAAALARAQALEPLRSNGAVFYRGQERLPLRCLDVPGLLEMEESAREELLDRAAAAGFNAVAFSAPLFGERGFCRQLGRMEEDRITAFSGLLARMKAKHLHSLVCLWDDSARRAFAAAGGGEERFFVGKAQAQWQAWLLRELLKRSPGEADGWILLRHPWPADPGMLKAIRNWLYGQLWVLRRAGASQLSGVGFLLKGDLGSERSGAVSPLVQDQPPPLAELMEQEIAPPEAAALDQLPPVPGDESTDPSSPLTPWDLEGVDWEELGQGLQDIPAMTGLDFLELTLDTEDWHRVGEAMAAMAAKRLCVPLLWRQDWRTASRYGRQQRLEPPAPLAGLAGPWPEDDWPEPGESIWPVARRGYASPPVLFKYLEVLVENGVLKLALHLNRPVDLELRWGRSYPPDRLVRSRETSLVHRLPLKGAKVGESVLLTARAHSERFGPACLRPRWLKLEPTASKGGH